MALRCDKPLRAENPPEPSEPHAEPRPAVIDSTTLLRGRAEVVIRHNGRDYRLRCTRLGKLILTA